MLEPLKYFVLIAEHHTLTAAARHAHVSQPAMTAALKRLEEDIGAPLFHRGPTGATLTSAGEALLPRARAALAAVDEGRRAVREILGLQAGSVRIGAGATICTYYLPPVLARFRREHPAVRIYLKEALSEEVHEGVASGVFDLGIVARAEGEPWLEDQLILVAAPGLETRDAPFVTFPRGTTTRELLDLHFPGHVIAVEIASISAVKGNVREGMGLALVSRRAVERDLAAGHLVEVPHPRTPIRRPLTLVHRGQERLPPAAARLREMLLVEREARTPRKKRST